MNWNWALATMHLFGLALGLPAVFLRGLGLRALRTDPGALARTLMADNVWGVAALLWVGSGLVRLFGPWDKGLAYYVHSGPFWIKMALVVIALGLEVLPMVALIRWRVALARGRPVDTSRVALLSRLNDAEVALTAAVPFFATAMARGLGFGWFD